MQIRGRTGSTEVGTTASNWRNKTSKRGLHFSWPQEEYGKSKESVPWGTEDGETVFPSSYLVPSKASDLSNCSSALQGCQLPKFAAAAVICFTLGLTTSAHMKIKMRWGSP